MAGYSGTPLPKKLGIKPGARVCFVNAPPGYAELLEPLPENVSVVCEESLALDLVHGFVASRAQLIELIKLYKKRIRAGWCNLGILAQKGVEDRHRCHRGHGTRSRAAGGPGRYQGLCG